jgi:hypothetical protein
MHNKTLRPTISMTKKGERGIWQRRFREHAIRDDADYAVHCDYIHYNPVKHGLVTRPGDWPYSSFLRFVQNGIYPIDWAAEPLTFPEGTGGDKPCNGGFHFVAPTLQAVTCIYKPELSRSCCRVWCGTKGTLCRWEKIKYYRYSAILRGVDFSRLSRQILINNMRLSEEELLSNVVFRSLGGDPLDSIHKLHSINNLC